MRRGLVSILILAAGLLVSVDGTAAVQCALQTSSCPGPGNLVATFGADVSPRRLPANKYVPVRWDVFGKVSTRDGTHPSALREVEFDIDKDVRINSRNYPVCEMSGRAIREANPKAVEKACAKALMGRGEATIEVAFPEQKPILVTSPITVFNGGESGGKVKLLIHVFLTVPVPAAIVTQVSITKRGTRIHAVAKVP
jgi:hypothetical protein